MACLNASTAAARTAGISNDVRDGSLWGDAMLQYLAMLPYVRSYEVQDSVLTLIGVAGSLAKFVRRNP